MRLQAIGRVDDPEQLGLDPLEVPVVGYTADREEVEEVFSFRPVAPAGELVDMMRATREDGGIPVADIMRFLDACVLPESRDAWTEFLHRPDLYIEQTTLGAVYRALAEEYGNRPTMPSSGSAHGRGSAKRTSKGASRSRASGTGG